MKRLRMGTMTATTYEEWMIAVRSALDSVNMSVEDWQSIWPFDFSSEYQKGTASADAAEKANRFWWYEQNKSRQKECLKTSDCWLPREHDGDCQPLS